MIEGYYNVREAAACIGVTPGRIRQMLTDGEISGKRANPRAWLIHKDEVERVANLEHATGRPRSGKK